jgi:hypothetical protein
MEYLEKIAADSSENKANIIQIIASDIYDIIDQKSKSKNFNIEEPDKIKQIVFLNEVFDEAKSKVSKNDVIELVKGIFKKELKENFEEYEKLIDSKKDEIFENFINFVFWYITKDVSKNKAYGFQSIQSIIWLYHDSIKYMLQNFITPEMDKKEIDDKINKILNVLTIIKDRMFDFKLLIEKVVETKEKYENPYKKEFEKGEIEKINTLIAMTTEFIESIKSLNNIINNIEKEILEEKLGELKNELKSNFADKFDQFIKKMVLGAGEIIKKIENPLNEIKQIFDEIGKIIEEKNEQIEQKYGRAWFLLNYLINKPIMGVIPEEKTTEQITSEKNEQEVKQPEIGFKMSFNIDFRKHIDEIYKKMEEIEKIKELNKTQINELKRFISRLLTAISPEQFIVRRKYYKDQEPSSTEVDDSSYIPLEEKDINLQSEININNGIYKKSSIDFKGIIDFAKTIFSNIKESINIVIKIIKNYRQIRKNLLQIEKELNIINDLLKEKNIVRSQYNNRFIQIKAEEEEQVSAWFGLKFKIKKFLDSILTINKRIQENNESEIIRVLNDLANKLENYPKFTLEEIAELKKLYDLILKIEKMELTTEKEKEIFKKMNSILKTLNTINTRIDEISKEIYLNFEKNKDEIKKVALQLARKRTEREFDVLNPLEKMAFENEEMLMHFVAFAESKYIQGEVEISNLLSLIRKAIESLEIEINVRIAPTSSKKYNVNYNIKSDVLKELREKEQKIDQIKKELKHEENMYTSFNKLSDTEKKKVILALKEKFKNPTFQNLVEKIRESILSINELAKNNNLFGNIKNKIDEISNDILNALKIYDEIIKDHPSIEEISNMFRSGDIKFPIEIFEKLENIEYIGKLMDTLNKIQNIKDVTLNLSDIYGVVKEIIGELFKKQEESNENIIDDKGKRDKIVQEILNNKKIGGDRRKIIENIIDLLPFYLTDEKEFDENTLKYLFDLLSYIPKKYVYKIKKKSNVDIIVLLNDLQELLERFGEEYIKFLKDINEILKFGANWFSKLNEALQQVEEETKKMKSEEIKDFIKHPVEYLKEKFSEKQPSQLAPTFAAAEIKKEILRKIAYFTPNYMTYKDYDLSGNRLKLLNTNNEKFIILSKDKDLKVGDKVEITKYPISKIGIITKKESDTMYKVVFDGMEDLVHIMHLKKIN